MHKSLRRVESETPLHLSPGRAPSPLIEIARDFSNLARPNAKEVRKFRDMFYVLVLRTTLAERKEISELLSRFAYTPRPVAIFFGMEDLDIAAPFLLFSPVLGVLDLNKIIEKHGLKHCEVIARRKDLDLATVQRLLDYDDEARTLENLLRHNSTGDNRSGILEFIDRRKIQEIPKALSKPLSGEASGHGSLMKKISDNFAQDKKPVHDLSNDLLSIARIKQQNTPALAKLPKAGSGQKTADIATKVLAKGQTGKAGKYLEYARSHDLDAMAELVESQLEMPQANVLIVLSGDNAGLQATLFCALGLSKLDASRLLLLLNNTVGRNADVFKTVMQKYEKLDQKTCIEYFANNTEQFIKQPTHVGHFSTAIAERRRNIETTTTAEPLHKTFGRRLSA